MSSLNDILLGMWRVNVEKQKAYVFWLFMELHVTSSLLSSRESCCSFGKVNFKYDEDRQKKYIDRLFTVISIAAS